VNFVVFEVLTTVIMNNAFFWDMTPYSLAASILRVLLFVYDPSHVT
jgi:hypothetical protein